MSETKIALAMLAVLTVDTDNYTRWWAVAASIFRIIALAYLAWYLWRGPEPVEIPRRRKGVAS